MPSTPASSSSHSDSYGFSLVIKLLKSLNAFDSTLAQAHVISARMDESHDRELDLIFKAGVLKIPCVYVEPLKLTPPPEVFDSWIDEAAEEEQEEEEEELLEFASKRRENGGNRFDVGKIPRNNRERDGFLLRGQNKKEGVGAVGAEEKLKNEFQSVLEDCEKRSEDIVEVVLDLVLESNRVKSGKV